jgi:hypothetical protein
MDASARCNTGRSMLRTMTETSGVAGAIMRAS